MTAATTEPLQADLEPSDKPSDEELVLADLLVEEISIDGMCGVY